MAFGILLGNKLQKVSSYKVVEVHNFGKSETASCIIAAIVGVVFQDNVQLPSISFTASEGIYNMTPRYATFTWVNYHPLL